MRASLPSRLFAALPDAVTAALFGLLWVAPAALGPGALKTGMLVMLVEFVLIHASAMLGGMLLGDTASTRAKFAAVLAFATLYLGFILAFSFAFDAWWPLLAFAWLLVGKFTLLFDLRARDADRMQRLQSSWAVAGLAYVLGVMATVFVPVPRLGITPSVVTAADLSGSGHWIDHPEAVVAFGLLYFATLATVKARDLRLPMGSLPRQRVD